MTGSRGICHAAPFMNGVIYCRVSSDEQVKGTSLESQEAACKEYAESHRINILKVFVERGESAKFADRTQLLELIDFCRQNKGSVEVLLVWKIDRFARNVTDHFSVKATLTKFGVRIVSVTEPIDTNPEGKLMETILAGFAQFDNDIRAMRTVQGMRRKLQEGLFPWKPPLGYRSANSMGEKKTKPDQPEQPIFGSLRKAWKELATGSYTKAEIRRMLTNSGVLTKKGRTLSPQSVDDIFRNPYYAGVLVDPWSGEKYAGRHVPMISESEFARIQQITAASQRSLPHQKDRPEFPLRGLVRCAECRRYLTGSFTKGRSRYYPYYHCTKFGCDRKSFAAETLHVEFGAFLDSIAPRPELVGKLGEFIVRAAEERQSTAKSQNARSREELSRVKKQVQELIGMRAAGLITDEEFMAQKRVFVERQAAIERRIAQAPVDLDNLRKELAEISEPLTRLRLSWETMQNPYRCRFQRMVLPVGFVNGKARTAELGLLFQAFRGFAGAESVGVAPVRQNWNRILREIREFSGLFGACRGLEHASEQAVPASSRE
jgi:site-specific DNA recombinase